MPDPLQTVDLAYLQSMFLRDLRMLFSGSRRQQLQMQCKRNTLVTLCRLLHQSSARQEIVTLQDSNFQVTSDNWQSWLMCESMTRLLYSIFCR